MTAGPFRPAAGPNAASTVLAELARLYDQAQHQMAAKGIRLTQARLAAESEVPLTTVNSWATGTALPRDAGPLEAVGAVLARWAEENPQQVWEWERLLEADQSARGALGGGGGGDTGAGRLIAELTDPFALEVHRPVIVDSAAELPVLPPYVRRPHDAELARVAARAVEGGNAMAVLVGGSSTGKTRACWEAIHELPAGWRLWHPFDPTRPEALLAELPRVGPRTVVWLNETQLYLDTPGDTGERVAAALGTLRGDASRAPVLVLGTLWPHDWATLTQAGAAHAQARRILDGTDITVPAAFTGPALADLQRAAASDVRLAAAAGAPQGEVTQYLAGVPELLARYRNAPPGARALIHAAMDARRLGHRPALPHALLAAAGPAYLSDTEWDAAGEDWLEQALAYTAALCKGVAGPLTRIRPRPASSRPRRPGSPDSGGREPDVGGGPVYRLADYLDQYGRRNRGDQFPPAGFWGAAAGYAGPGDQAALGGAARARGLYRDGAQLYKEATIRGNFGAAVSLIDTLDDLRPTDRRPVHWAVSHAALDDPADVVSLLDELQEVGADRQVIALLDRDPAAHVALDDPDAVTFLLGGLREVGADRQVIALADRAAAHAALDDPVAVVSLLGGLQEVGADRQVIALLDRDPAAHVALDDPYCVTFLLSRLQEVGADRQVTALADRAAAHAPLDDPAAVAILLGGLQEVGADRQVTALADRAAVHAPLDDPAAVTILLAWLQKAGADRQVTVLIDRAAAHAPLDDPAAVAILLGGLQEVGADRQVTALLDRDPAAHVALDDPEAVAFLLYWLREVGADRQVTALADRAAAHVALDDPAAVAILLYWLREVGADRQVIALLDRDPAAHVALDNARAVTRLLGGLREAGADRQVTALADRAAAHAALDNPDAVTRLLGGLREAGADRQVTVLIDRAAAHAPLDDPAAVAILLARLQEAGADRQVTALADRAAAHAALDNPDAVAILLAWLREAGADRQVTALADRAAAHAALDNPRAVTRLLGGLREAGADRQVTALADRAAAHAALDDPAAVATLLAWLREAGADRQVTALADRAAAHAALDDPAAVATLLAWLREAGADRQVTALADRAAAHAALDNPAAVATLLARLWEAGADRQVTVLSDRLPAAGMFGLFQEIAGSQFRFGREPDGSPARSWGWNDLS